MNPAQTPELRQLLTLLTLAAFASSASFRVCDPMLPVLAGLLASASIWAAPALPEPLRPVLERSLDDPRAAFALVGDAALDALDSEARFWRLLGKAALYTLLDRTSEAQRSVDEARARLGLTMAA